MTEYETIIVERRGDVLGITLDRPERQNAAPPEMFDEIASVLADLGGARAVLLMGAGKSFCVGGELDRGEMGSLEAHAALSEHFHPVIETLADLDVPFVTAVQGAATGMGCSLALAADFCIAADTAYFQQQFVDLGLVPEGGGSWYLPRLIGYGRALEMTMLGERIKSERALEWGMVYRLVPEDVLEREAWMFADRLARGPTRAMGMIRRQIRFGQTHGLTETMALEAENQRAALATQDAHEGGKAFVEKREPEFRGA